MTLASGDYEYTTIVRANEAQKIYLLLNGPHKEQALLRALAARFIPIAIGIWTNACYSNFQTFLDENKIAYQGSS